MMLASVQQDGLNMTITPGFTWDSEEQVFKGPVLYGDEILMLCVKKERMQRALTGCFEINGDIEQLFDVSTWISDAEHTHDLDVYFEEE